MKQKQPPLRTCMGCNTKKEKQELLRIVRNKQNEVFIDNTGKAEGRGAYLCKHSKCLEKALKNKRLERALSTRISEKMYEELKNELFAYE